MALTPEQTAAISAELSVDLATVTDDRLIELCLLYRSAPEALPAFPALLEAEITRRFTAAEIAANDVMFSVIQNFSNQFTSGIPFFAKKMLEMSASVNRDIWFSNNTVLFTDATNNNDLMSWMVSKPDILTKVLHNSIALPIVAQSSIAATAVLTNAEAVAIFKDTPNVWEDWTQYSAGMSVVAQSSELMTYVIDNTVAMASVAASSIAMTAVAESSVALSAIVKSTSARNALMGSNTVFQNNRVAIYNTVKASWTKQAGVSHEGVDILSTTINSAINSPVGFVFASLGYGELSYKGTSKLTHGNASVAATASSSAKPKNLNIVDAVSFNGSTVYFTGNYGAAYAELWIPPAI